MKYFLLVFVSVMLLLLIFTAVSRTDSELLNDRIYNSIFYERDCDFDLYGTGYYLATLNGEYVICKDDYGIHCLTGFQFAGIGCIYPDIKPPATFKDSCSAKGYLVAYIKQEAKSNIQYGIKRVGKR